VAVKILITS